MKAIRNRRTTLPALLLVVAALTFLSGPASARHFHAAPHGTWYLALDATPYGLAGLSLPGMVTLHADRTVLISDAGDFGGLPFGTADSPQFGGWRYTGSGIKIVTLFLKADLVGDVEAWYRVEIDVRRKGRNKLKGVVNVYRRDCDLQAPFAAFSCPNPIEKAGEFIPADLPDVPVTLYRLRP